MKKHFKHLFALLLSVAMCLSCSVVSFAASNDIASTVPASAENAGGISTYSAGNTLYATTADFSDGRGQVSITTTEANWDAQYMVAVLGDSTGEYRISMKAANGAEYDMGIVYGDGKGAMCTQVYAKAGTYTFYVTAMGTGNPIHVIVQIYD